MAALFTRMSTVPKRSSVASMAACALSGSAMSVFTNAPSPPPASSAAVRVPCSSPMSAIITLAPSARNRRVYAVPIPLPPPVTIATLSWSRIVISPRTSPLVVGRDEVGPLARIVDRDRVGFGAVAAEHVECDLLQERLRHHALHAVRGLEHEAQPHRRVVDALEHHVAPIGGHESAHLVEARGNCCIVHRERTLRRASGRRPPGALLDQQK